jgi:S-adenosylmethionine decarboxylase
MDALGSHLILDLWGCNDRIRDPEVIRNVLVQGAQAANATVVQILVHTFNPHGVTGVAILAESHFALHTWPEHGCLAADLFTCASLPNALAVTEVLKEHFQPEHIRVQQVSRGGSLERPHPPKRHTLSPATALTSPAAESSAPVPRAGTTCPNVDSC